eukprot:TRINITY_DN14897_c0_g1_i1.p1 TRINITY_DN14897_c0_g1~~TRINITY_DN14897_c0_g1_i1.p1  ORF type:complete len:226 (+),score=16.47 TRINITY_DN14897_c0_g1_i1:117-794(+)
MSTYLLLLVLVCVVSQSLCQLDEEICYDSDEVVKAFQIISQAQKCNHVWMSKSEQDLLMAYLHKNISMLEVGSGYSTLWYSQFVGSYVSVEHDAAWYNKVKKMIDQQTSQNRNISYNLAAVNWSWSKGEGSEKEFGVYLDKIEELSQGRKWDVVLDDGRARVAVAQRVLKHLNSNAVVIIHDFWQRSYYHSILKLYDVIASVHDGQSIVMLKPKTSVRTSTEQQR